MLLVVGSISVAAPSAGAAQGAREVHIGALLSLTGDGATLGTTSKAALEIAAQRWNSSRQGKQVKVVLDVENTNLEAEQAQAALTRLADKGVRIAIGPQSSSEVAAISDQADARGVLLVSQGSTASSLGLPDDNVYRFVPTDRVEGRASVDLMLKNGATTIVPMWRNDRGNNGLADSVRAAATASGATVTDGVRYEPGTTDFSAALADLSTQVQAAVGSAGPDKVAVYLAGFEEVADVFTAARTVTGLDGVPWYGGDGSAQSKALLASGPATFATSVKVKGYPSPLVAVPAALAKRDAKLVTEISKRAKNPADAFTLAAYDAFNVAARTLSDTPPDADAAALRAAFARTAEGAKGTTGTVRLDPAGDRVSTPYAFWSVCQQGKSPRWTETGTWTPASDPTAPGQVTPKSCPKA
ncbi:MAG TPA: ABC transporter substrate-binding protein [Acidimicrobiia bacterium]|nr:ABC transporter substrate-binding protein [Acidimicrobiia bacterium]